MRFQILKCDFKSYTSHLVEQMVKFQKKNYTIILIMRLKYQISSYSIAKFYLIATFKCRL